MIDEQDPSSAVSQKGLAVAVITIARYLASQQPNFGLFLRAASDHAAAAGLAPADLAFLELLITSVT